MKLDTIHKYFSFSVRLILFISIFNAAHNHLWHLASTSIFLLILLLIPQIITKYKIEIPPEFEWILLIFVIINLFLGKTAGIITAIVFGIAVAMAGFMILAILYSNSQIKKNYFLIIFFSFNFSVSFGIAIELAKYYLKILLNQSLSPDMYSYSMQTITFVILGALISSLIGYIYMKYHFKIFRRIFYRIVEKNPSLFVNPENIKEEILELIKKGESEKLEFKSTFRTNLYTDEIDRKVEYSALKTIAAFLNSKGGTLLIGVNDSKEIIGTHKDNFAGTDKFSLHITNLIKSKLGKNAVSLIKIEFMEINKKIIIKIECKKGNKPFFLKSSDNEEEFYIRAGPSSVQIKGSELIEYIEKNIKDKNN